MHEIRSILLWEFGSFSVVVCVPKLADVTPEDTMMVIYGILPAKPGPEVTHQIRDKQTENKCGLPNQLARKVLKKKESSIQALPLTIPATRDSGNFIPDQQRA